MIENCLLSTTNMFCLYVSHLHEENLIPAVFTNMATRLFKEHLLLRCYLKNCLYYYI